MFLLWKYRDVIIPAMEEKIVRQFDYIGTRKVVIVKQEDGAGLHMDSTYFRGLKSNLKKRLVDI